jgi:small conductance mechanosensitive channel
MTTADLSSIGRVSIGDMALSTLFSAILSFLVCFIVIKLVMKLVDKLMANPTVKLDGTIKGFLRNAIYILLWAVAVIIVANALGIDTTSLVAVVSIAGLALSLSVQNILANLFSGLTLLITKPFAAGNFIEAAGKSGLVKTVGLFYTTMDTLDNVSINIPNSEITGSTIYNYSREPLRRVDMTFCTSYDVPTEDAKKAIGPGYGINRYKGLGEMNPDQLAKTTMNIETRKLYQVKIDDPLVVEKRIATLMGNDASKRREWIEANIIFNEEDKFIKEVGGKK